MALGRHPTFGGGALVRVDGGSLTPRAVAEFARSAGPWEVDVDDAAMARVDAAHDALLAAAERGEVYGITTGVGANRDVEVAPADRAGQGMRLLRSHAAGVGPPEPDDVVRATMLVRLNQLLEGRSGVSANVVRGLVALIGTGRAPVVHGYGAIGTGDLGAVAEVGLVLAGERAGADEPVGFGPGDALAWMSTSALTVARAALAAADLRQLLEAATCVGALSTLGLRGSMQPFDPRVNDRAGRPGQSHVAAIVRRLAAGGASSGRVQDPFGVRTMPAVHGAAIDAIDRLDAELEVELNHGVENPAVAGEDVIHHGNFQLSSLAAALDGLRGALVPLAALSIARVAALVDHGLTGLPPFLAAGPAGSSGVMGVEYVAHDALAELRARAHPVSLAAAPLWLTGEEHASFATQAARRSAESVEPLAHVLAAELVAAARALRLAPDRLGHGDAVAVYALVAGELDDDLGDRPLDRDLRTAAALLADLAAFGRRP